MAQRSGVGSVLDRAALVRTRTNFQSASGILSNDAVRTLAREVVSRVAQKPQRVDIPQLPKPSRRRILALTEALLAETDDVSADMIDACQAEGMTVETLYLGLISGAADELGQRWERDELTFLQVTLGAGRILGILRGLRHVIRPEGVDLRRHALFAAVPGESHVVGPTMATDLLRRDGWDIDLQIGLDHDALVAVAEEAEHLIIGLSASGHERFEDLTKLVVALRASIPAVMIILGGHIVEEMPDIQDLIGVDAISRDVQSMHLEMDRLLEMAGPRG